MMRVSREFINDVYGLAEKLLWSQSYDDRLVGASIMELVERRYPKYVGACAYCDRRFLMARLGRRFCRDACKVAYHRLGGSYRERHG